MRVDPSQPLAKKKSAPFKKLIAIGILSLVLLTSFVFIARGKKFKPAWHTGNYFGLTGSTGPATAILREHPMMEQAQPGKTEAAIFVDTVAYREKMLHLLNGDSSGMWPVSASYPRSGAILPFKRVIAFYGNLYSKRMGILGELPPDDMLEKLTGEVNRWKMADTTMDVVPALHYIATTAQSAPGKGGKYLQRMPFKQIDSVISMAKRIDAIVFLDIQIGLSNLEVELPMLEPYLSLPNVHLGIDPEFAMKNGTAPGKAVGSFDAEDINYASEFLARLVRESNLPPKILVVHRFTKGMVTNYKNIHTKPEVQLVMHMDGWGGPAKKLSTYQLQIRREPVQFTGFKLFYKNDIRDHNRLLTPGELLVLKPQPVYIQYQ